MLSRRSFCVLLPGAARYLTTLPAEPSAGLPEDDWRFASPPDSARPYVLWMWMGSNISAEGITRDLEAMREAGIGGATIFSLADTTVPWAGFIGKSPTPDVITFHEPWWALVRHAAAEAHRLGLELILHNCAGYESSGGPWITPELSMQEIVFSKTSVAGETRFSGTLPRPTVDLHPHANFPQCYIPSLGRIAVPEVPARQSYFVDIAAIAVPTAGTIAPTDIHLLDTFDPATGHCDWQAPEGDWTLYRFGHTTTGAMIQPAQWEAMGLECDKMNKEAVAFHVNHVLADIKAHLGELLGKGVTTLYFDSYEAGTPNWTPTMAQEFKDRRGYDILPWMPALAGRTIGDAPQTAKFKQDFKRTVQDLFRDNYWATPGPPAHAAGVKFIAEPYDGPWEIAEVVPLLDVPTVEFWTHGNRYSPVEVAPIVKAAAEHHMPLVSSEAFTSDPKEAHWDEHPGWLKPIGDAAFCDGVNRFNLHHFVQQPWDARYKPGNTMGQWGVHFGRYQTWWRPAKAWFTYLWRCQNLLQRGNYIPPSAATSAVFSDLAPAPGSTAQPELRSVRRNVGSATLFFVANIARTPGSATISLPVTGVQPELWDPVWGTTVNITGFETSAGATTFHLDFAAAQSYFLVFRKPLPPRSPLPAVAKRSYQTIATLDGPWTVRFDPAWGGPASTTFAELTDWSQHADPGIRFYSGTAVYRRAISIPRATAADRTFLDLGLCHHIAEITLNGKPAGVLWTAPWRIDITPALRPGENVLEIAVSNVWANRLIGDERQPPDLLWEQGDAKLRTGDFLKEFPDWFLEKKPRPSAGRYTFTTWNYFTADSPLVPSGLLGPVTLVRSA